MHTYTGGNCSLSESDLNESDEVWDKSDEEVWNENFDTDLELQGLSKSPTL